MVIQSEAWGCSKKEVIGTAFHVYSYNYYSDCL